MDSSDLSDLSNGDALHFLLLSILDLLAIACNLLLITAILTSTPIILRNYSLLLLIMASVDCTAAVASLLSGVIIENMEGAVLYIYIGPCRLIHKIVCEAALGIHVQSIGEQCILLLISFSYRLFSFSSTISGGLKTDIRARLFNICLMATIPSVITTFTFANSPSPPPPSLLKNPELEGRLFSVFNMTADPFLSTENILPRVSIMYIMFIYLTASPVLFVLRRRLLKRIRELVVASDKYRHKMILRSLTIQMFLPAFFSVAFVFWLVDFLEIYQLKVFQRSIMGISSTFTLISPLIILYYLPPYRKFVLGFFSCVPTEKDTVLTVMPSV